MKKHAPFRRGSGKAVVIHFIFQETRLHGGGTPTRTQSAQVDCSTTYERLKQMACFLLGINGTICLWLLDDKSPQPICLKDKDPVSKLISHDSTLLVEQIRAVPEVSCAQMAWVVDDSIPRATAVGFLPSNGHTSDEQLAWLLSSELNCDTAPTEFGIETQRKKPPVLGKTVAQGNCSQFTIEGGKSACTAICLYAAASLLLNIDEMPMSITSETLDNIIQVGVVLYQEMELHQQHTNVDDLWYEAAFPEVVSSMCRGDPMSGMVSIHSFQDKLEEAMRYGSSRGENSVAVVVTKPPETVLLVCKDIGCGGPWFFFDSHGQIFESTKRAYVKQFESLECAAAALMAKFPLVSGLGESLGAQHLNMFEAHPIVYQRQHRPEKVEQTGSAATADEKKCASPPDMVQSASVTSSTSSALQPSPPKLDTDHFRDLVSLQVFADPVFCDQGHTHERSWIESWFRSRRQEKAREEERKLDQGEEGDATQCNRQSNFDPTCPYNGEAISEILIENQQCERMVVACVESGAICLDEDDLEDWKARREEKAKMVAARRAEQQRSQNKETPSSVEPEARPIDKETVHVERPIEGTLSDGPVDVGLSVALCPSSWQRPQSTFTSRCSNSCCSTSLSSSSQASCARCDQIYCSSCLRFSVTEATNHGHLCDTHLVCTECIWQISDVLASDGSHASLVKNLDSMVVCFFQGLTERNSLKQHELCHRQKHLEYTKIFQAVNSGICALRHIKGALENQILEAKAQAEQARLDAEGDTEVEATAREIELVTKCLEIQQEHDELEAKGRSDEDELEYVLRLSGLQSQFQALSAELIEVRDVGTNAESSATSLTSREHELVAECMAVQKEHDELEAEGPSGEDDLEYALRLNELQSQFQALSAELIQARESGNQKTRAVETSHVASSKGSFIGGSFRFLARKVLGEKKKASGTPGANRVFGEKKKASGSPKAKPPTANAGLLSGDDFAAGDFGEPVVDDSTAADMAADLAAIGLDDVGNPELPLDLDYPSVRMRNQVLFMRNELERRRLESEREFDDLYSQRRNALEAERDRLEDEIAAARREVADAQAAAAEEERLKQERARRRCEAEQERLRKERERAAEERRIQQEKERLERVRKQQEEKTRASLKGIDLRQCGGCGFGPFERFNCMDMAAHNDKIYVIDSKGRRRKRGRNECPECGWTNSDWRNWPKFRP